MKMNIAGVNLNFTDTGEKDLPAIVIMHGWGCNLRTVESIAALFRGRMRVINLDLPGHGESSEPPFIWGVEEFASMLEQLVSQLGLKNPSLLGHSFGGRVAILYGSRNKVDRVVLVDAAGIKPRRKLDYYAKIYSYKFAKRVFPLLMGKSAAGKIMDKWRSKSGSADYRNSSPVMRGVMSKCVNQDLKEYMPSIKAPTLLIWGENDTATPLSDAKTMEKLIPDAGLVSFAGCGHYSFLDNPAGFRAVINSFFKDILS